MTIEEKRAKLYEMCADSQHCDDCELDPYCGIGDSGDYIGYFNSLSEEAINRWFEMFFGEDAERQEDKERGESDG